MAHDNHGSKNYVFIANNNLATPMFDGVRARVGMGPLRTRITRLERIVEENPLPLAAPMTKADLVMELGLAGAYFEIASSEGTRAAQSKTQRDAAKLKLLGFVRQLSEVHTGAVALAKWHGFDVKQLDIPRGPTAALFLKFAYGLHTWLEENGKNLGDPEAVAQWKSIVGSILVELPDVMRSLDGIRGAVAKSAVLQAKAHAACEVTVKRIVEGLRVAFWNDPSVLTSLKLGSGGRPKTKQTATPAPVAASTNTGSPESTVPAHV